MRLTLKQLKHVIKEEMQKKPHKRARAINVDGEVWHWLVTKARPNKYKASVLIWDPDGEKHFADAEDVGGEELMPNPDRNDWDGDSNYEQKPKLVTTPSAVRRYIEDILLGMTIR